MHHLSSYLDMLSSNHNHNAQAYSAGMGVGVMELVLLNVCIGLNVCVCLNACISTPHPCLCISGSGRNIIFPPLYNRSMSFNEINFFTYISHLIQYHMCQ